MSLQHAMNWFILKWSRLLMTRGFVFYMAHLLVRVKTSFWMLTILWHSGVTVALPISIRSIWFMAILYKFKISLQEVVWGTTSNMWLASARCWVKLQAEKQDTFVYTQRHQCNQRHWQSKPRTLIFQTQHIFPDPISPCFNVTEP